MKQMMLPVVVLLAILIASFSFLGQGVAMHDRVPVEEAKFHELQNNYFVINKVEREAAPTGSELNQQLAQIQNYPSTLLELKLVGIGKILIGIFFLLLSIAFLLFMMPIRLGTMMKK